MKKLQKQLGKKLRAIPFNQSATRLISVAASIVLLLFFVFVIIARSVSASYERREREQRTDAVTSVANSFDKMIDSASELALMFYAKDAAYQMGLLRDGKTQQCEKLLTAYISSFPVVDNVILMTSSQNRVLSVCSRREINPEVFKDCLTMDYGAYLKLFENNADMYILSVLNKPGSSSLWREIDNFSYVRQIISTKDGTPLGLMFINFKRKALRTMLGVSNLPSDENITVINRENEYIFSARNDVKPVGVRFSALTFGYNGNKFVSSDGEQLEIYGSRITERPYRLFLSGKKTGSFFSQFGSGIPVIIAIIIICVLLLLYLAWILFFQNRTLHNVKNILEQPDDGNLNRIIIKDSSSIEGIVSRQVIYVNQLKQQNDDQRTVMRRKLLNDLLTARAPIDAKAETAQLERVGIPVENRCFIVINFEICDLKDSPANAQNEQEYALMQFVTENILRDYSDCVSTRLNDRIVCLFSTDSALEAQDMVLPAQKIIEVCKKEFEHTVCAGIGSVSLGLTAVSRSYYRACAALDFALDSSETVCLFKDISGKRNEQSEYARIIESKFHFLNLIKAKDYDGARKSIDWIFDKKSHGSRISAEFISLQCYELLRTCGEYFADSDKNSLIDAMSDRIDYILYCRDPAILRRQFYETLEQIITLGKSNENTVDFVDEIAAIVEREYANPDLSVSFIADMMQQNPRTLSAKFIKKTGNGLLDYIHKVRIEKAKELLTVGGKSVQEVTYLTGYENPNTFIRIFKRYSGITPGRYREMYSEQ